MSSNVQLLSFHDYRHFQEELIDLLNDEWPQSKTIRLRRLDRSCDELPTIFILVENDSNGDRLLGSCYVDRLLDEEQSVFVESICIQRARRGTGYGRKLMMLLEDKLQARQPKIETIYLSTTDKRDFYAKCGYEETTPRVRFNISNKLFNGNEQLLKSLMANQSQPISNHVILQKGSTIQRIPTVWMKKQLNTR